MVPIIWCDNKSSTTDMLGNPMLHAKTKHIEHDIYFVRQKIQQKVIELKHIPIADEIADMLTKALFSNKFLFI